MNQKQLERKLTKLFYKMLKVVEKTNKENYDQNLKIYYELNIEYSELENQRRKLQGLNYKRADKFDKARNALAEALQSLQTPQFSASKEEMIAEAVKKIQEKE